MTPVALAIAGSDPAGGAGIQGDLKTFEAHGVFGTTAITALTVQNTRGVTRVAAIEPGLVVEQIDAVVSDLGAAATKIGMLANGDIVLAVARAIARHGLNNVVADVVIAATGGHRLLDERGVIAFRDHLMPLATVVTPNALEAALLSDMTVRNIEDARAAARRIVEQGARAVIVKGGHIEGPESVDVLFDGRQLVELRAARIDTRHTHGTGCAYSSAIAARLALGDDLITAARAAKAYVTRAIASAPGLGHGHGPLGFRT
jgi:hydroxymethylpyrimidine/phosphomethylpyrimidine kinase